MQHAQSVGNICHVTSKLLGCDVSRYGRGRASTSCLTRTQSSSQIRGQDEKSSLTKVGWFSADVFYVLLSTPCFVGNNYQSTTVQTDTRLKAMYHHKTYTNRCTFSHLQDKGACVAQTGKNAL